MYSEHSIADQAFFDQPDMSNPTYDPDIVTEMVVDATNSVPNGESETPSGGDEGPWTISVADAPSHKNKKKYTIYIQTPAQNLTLTRATQEITELHAKLRSNYPSASLPPLPAFPTSRSDRGDNAKRHSSFLNTLSLLVNPSPNVSKAKALGPTNAGTITSTSMISPRSSATGETQSSESQWSSFPTGEDDPARQTTLALAAYLNLVGNHRIFRCSRAWRRFVRVRASDLASARADHVVRRVRNESGLGRVNHVLYSTLRNSMRNVIGR